MHALRQDEYDLDASGRGTRAGKVARWWKRNGEPRSAKDRRLLAVAFFARLDAVSAPEFQMLCDHLVPPESAEDVDR